MLLSHPWPILGVDRPETELVAPPPLRVTLPSGDSLAIKH